MECVRAQTRSRFILSSEWVFREWGHNPCQLQGKNHLYRKLRGGSNPRQCIMHDSKPNTQPTELYRPHEHSSSLPQPTCPHSTCMSPSTVKEMILATSGMPLLLVWNTVRIHRQYVWDRSCTPRPQYDPSPPSEIPMYTARLSHWR